MTSDATLDRPVAALQVSELIELIRATVRTELAAFLRETYEDELAPLLPATRDIDTVLARMQATGKYNKKFLASLRKGMERSQSFQRKPNGAKA